MKFFGGRGNAGIPMQPPGLGGLPGLNFCFSLPCTVWIFWSLWSIWALQLQTDNVYPISFRTKWTLKCLWWVGVQIAVPAGFHSGVRIFLFCSFLHYHVKSLKHALIHFDVTGRRKILESFSFSSLTSFLFFYYISFCVDLLFSKIVQLSFKKLCRY